MTALRWLGKFLASKPLWVAVAVVAGWLWWQEWSAHRATARIAAAHYVTVETRESAGWERTRFICAGGPVEFATGFSDEEILRLAREHGLTLVETRTVEGPERRVEVPVFVSDSGERVRVLGEHRIAAGTADYGGDFLGGVNDAGKFFGDFKPAAEPYSEKIGSWYGGGRFGWAVAEVPDLSNGGTKLDGALDGGLRAGYEWRRTGRAHHHLEVDAGWNDVEKLNARVYYLGLIKQLPQRRRLARAEADDE